MPAAKKESTVALDQDQLQGLREAAALRQAEAARAKAEPRKVVRAPIALDREQLADIDAATINRLESTP